MFDTAPVALYELDLRALQVWLDERGLRAAPDQVAALAPAELDTALALITITDVNDVALRWASATREQLLESGVNPVNRIGLVPILVAFARGDSAVEVEIALEVGGQVRQVLVRAEFPAEVVALGRVVVSAADITEMRRAAEDLHAAQRLDSLVQLAGSVAHDFNNLLTVARLHLDRLARRVPQAEGKELDGLRKATSRAASLAHQLLLFSRRDVAQRQVFDPDPRLGELADLLRRSLDPSIAIELALAGDAIAVDLDPRQLEQAVHNLVNNAADAMPNGGALRIERSQPRADGRVVIAVSDTGAGMDEATRARACEACFTTRPGKRAGLGLTIAQGIANSAGGELAITSSPGEGTRVELVLPIAQPIAGERPRGPVDAARPRARILLVEDEPGLREVARATLDDAGYDVVVASSGEAALHASADAAALDLVISDLVLPGLGGRELVARLHSARPALAVLYTSGYAADGPPALDGAARVAFLAKPFTAAQLLASVGEVLAP